MLPEKFPLYLSLLVFMLLMVLAYLAYREFNRLKVEINNLKKGELALTKGLENTLTAIKRMQELLRPQPSVSFKMPNIPNMMSMGMGHYREVPSHHQQQQSSAAPTVQQSVVEEIHEDDAADDSPPPLVEDEPQPQPQPQQEQKAIPVAANEVIEVEDEVDEVEELIVKKTK